MESLDPTSRSLKSSLTTQRGLIILENRLELLFVEVQQERDHLIRVLLLATAVGICGLLAGLTLTAALVAWLWAWSHGTVLIALTGLYTLAGLAFYSWLMGLTHSWQSLSATIEQLRKDRACVQKILE